jgi:hypothetical protein
MKQRAGFFLEESLAVVLGREALGEPLRKASGAKRVYSLLSLFLWVVAILR